MDNRIPTPPNQPQDGTQHIRLACQGCQRKKIKCDRTFPCTQCQRSSLQCIPSTRKPRARQIGKRAVDSELRSRISKLESLVETLSGEVGVPEGNQAAREDAVTPPDSANAALPAVGKYIGSPFWANLTGEVQALRDALEEDGSDEEPSSASPTTAPERTGSTNVSERTSMDHDLLVCPPSSVYVMPGALPDPPLQMASELYSIFYNNVDKVFKILHVPTVKRFVNNNDAYMGYPPNSPPSKALKAAMWFGAVTTIRDSECFARFRMSKAELLRLYRRHVDVALTQADLMCTNDIPTLQAAAFATAASRIGDPSRRSWTMTGLIVRVAFGMGLHHEIPDDSPYLKETKRRLWHQIRVLDAFVSVDRGTEPLIKAESFSTPLPSSVNDSDYDESSEIIQDRAEGLSDVSFTLMAHAATSLTIRFLTPDTSAQKRETWQQRLDMAVDLGKQLREKYLKFCDLSISFNRWVYAVGNSMAASSVLRAVRPMQRHTSSVPPRVDGPFVLQLAVNSLRESEATYQDPEADGWRWMVWTNWHALAVALAGLCSVRDTELANTAWMYVDKAYDRCSKQIADTRSGMLWRPIEKLYKKAAAFRDGRAPSSHRASVSPFQPNKTSSPTTMPPHTGTPPGYLNVNEQLQLVPGPESFNGPFYVGDDIAALSPVPGGDISWMDWESIMQDISSLSPDAMNTDLTMNNDTSTNFNVNGFYNNAGAYPNVQGGGWQQGFYGQ